MVFWRFDLVHSSKFFCLIILNWIWIKKIDDEIDPNEDNQDLDDHIDHDEDLPQLKDEQNESMNDETNGDDDLTGFE